MNARTALLATTSVVIIVLLGSPLQADFVFGTPTNAGPAINSSGVDFGPFLCADGLELYFSRGAARADIWVARRTTPDSEWETASNIGPPVNLADNGNPFLTPDGLTLFFDGDRPGTYGTFDLWVTTRATTDDTWDTPVNLGATVNTSAEDWGVSLSADELELYFTSNRPGGSGDFDLWMTTRATVNGNWGTPVNLGPPLNTSAGETFPSISRDGLALFFCSSRSGGYGNLDLYMARRATTNDPWDSPVNLGPAINSSAFDNCVKVSADGSMLYFASLRGGFGSADIWQIPILPVVDFNGQGSVDIEDLVTFIEQWDKADSRCDIGPFAWGDGKVDAADLEVLMSYWDRPVDDPTLVGHWPFDETEGTLAHDRTMQNDGTVLGLPQWRPQGGTIDGALELNGATFVMAGCALAPAAGSFSVLTWVKGGAPGQNIISQQVKANWLSTDAQGALVTELSKSDRVITKLTSQAVVTDGNWHRIALTWDGANRRLYVDSALVAEDIQNTLSVSSDRLILGAGKTLTAGTFWTGLIDDVRIYNRAVKP